ncbi:4-(cytidine 5'-diphospho)-2-C-methyl-D-erythritol kinase [Solibaculum mannosilyticum]|uniref:4-(cytidine 5'-diphospho)-2-C-methyl-D-erythritol kinase n=1 Tax=Solibaculum mannosilyticum TaxID=2780922 RepID=UPI0034B49D1A
MSILVKAPAKINLSLDITGRRDDGYHLVRMVMQSVDLCDIVEVDLCGEGISLSCSRTDLPVDEGNLAYRAARLYLDHVGVDKTKNGVSIHIQKRIPIAAGLAGGSADAAAVLVALNSLYGQVKPDALSNLAAKLGADVPFCLQGGTSLAQDIGTTLSPLPSPPDCFLVLCKPDVGVSTQEAYRRFDDLVQVSHPDVDGMIDALADGNIDFVVSSVNNVFEQVICIPELDHIRSVMNNCGAMVSCMSGSGPTIFGIFRKEAEAKICWDHLAQIYNDVFVTRPIAYGCKIIENH